MHEGQELAGERAAHNDALRLIDELKAELRDVNATLDGYRRTALAQERRINELEAERDRAVQTGTDWYLEYCKMEADRNRLQDELHETLAIEEEVRKG